MARDPKAKIVDGKRRAFTIHDGTRLTPAVVAVLGVLADAAADEVNDTEAEYRRENAREALTPVLVARADGVAIYLDRNDRRLG